ncbi:type II toxin-antitoxin system prevent-host-death family antitoxin [Nocardiopsis ganjiahuensis]|uniref:type II toxin-antitoxin system prevent-host-death family antitoxin n=1 Tax=Nocardiopsis ganjiahuensis TaxID=239984 RepID=UPI000345D0BC|nr:type II toxin-antitoxin system prevent-host-death family antitoxin [Nocardiopsis ganjiahuensis]
MSTDSRVMSSGDARTKFRELLSDVDHGAHIEIRRYGAPTAVVVPPDWYERALAALKQTET